MLISYYNRPIQNNRPDKIISIQGVIKKIRTEYQEETETLRTFKDKKKASKYKGDNFDFVTWSGIFETRKVSDVKQYTGLVVIDIDNLNQEIIKTLKKKIIKDTYVLCSFVSPSGTGLKIVFQTDNKDPGKHNLYFKAIEQYFNKQYSIKIDASGKDISRACFLCYDPDVYFKEKARIWTDCFEEKTIKDYSMIDIDNIGQYNFVDKGEYFKVNCPKCNRPDAYLYKNSLILKCSHIGPGKCNYIENLITKKLDEKIEALTVSPNDKKRKKEIYLLIKKLDHIDREKYFKVLKKLWSVKAEAVEKDYQNYIRDVIVSEYRTGDFSFKIPAGWEMDNSGIVHGGKKQITYEPFYISDVGSCKQTGIEYIELTYNSNGRTKKIKVDRQAISITKDLLETSIYGTPVNSANSMEIIKFLDAWHSINKKIFPGFDVVNQLGWNKDENNDFEGFVLSKKIISLKENFRRVEYIGSVKPTAFVSSGNISGWTDTIKKLKKLKNGEVVRFLIYAGFASAILEPLNLRPFIIHLHGDTSLGKTTALKIVSSIYGRPEETFGFIRWKNTLNFIVRYMENLKNLPLVIDELSTEEKKTMDNIVYLMEGGSGKGKASKLKPMEVEAIRSFKMGVFSSGEPPLISDRSLGGVYVRVWEFSGSPFGEINKDLIKKIESGIGKNFGSPIEIFLKNFLLDPKLYLDDSISFFEDKTNNKEERVLKILNTIYRTGLSINEIFGLDFPVKKDMKKIFDVIRQNLTSKSATTENFIDEVRGFYASQSEQFLKVEMDPGGQSVEKMKRGNVINGYKFGNDLGIIQKVFTDTFRDSHGRRGTRYIIDRLIEGGYVKERRTIKRINGARVSLVYFLDFFDPEEKKNDGLEDPF